MSFSFHSYLTLNKNLVLGRKNKLGRPLGPGKSKLEAFRPEIEALLANGSTQKYIARRYNATEATVSNWVKKSKIRQADL